MHKTLLLLFAATCFGQVTIQDGTKLRVRLEQTLSSATADEGQPIELSVMEAVKVGDIVVVPQGAAVAGTITQAVPKRRMGRAGKLDFSIDRVRAADGEWVPIRYSIQKKSGNSHSLRTGIITAGVAYAFFPAAPFVLLMKGKDVVLNKGITFEVFTDNNHELLSKTAVAPVRTASDFQGTATEFRPSTAATIPGTATVVVTSAVPGADIELDGAFVGNTPATLHVEPGSRRIIVKDGSRSWQRIVQITSGSTVSLNAATFDPPAASVAALGIEKK
jgi:hypothetical protein